MTGEYRGDRDLRILGVKPIGEAGGHDLTFLSNEKYAPLLKSTHAGAVLVGTEQPGQSERWIRVPDPAAAIADVLQKWFAQAHGPEGISTSSYVHSSVKLGANVRIGDGVSIGADSRIGDDVTIFAGTFIGASCSIDDGTTIYPNATLYHGTTVGKRCIVHASVVIGSDGYGFTMSKGRHKKIPQIGIVRIDDDVEIGAGTTIDRGALGETTIGEGTKIDNLVHIAHNVKIGKHCLIVAQVGISGSSEVGDYSVLAGQAGVAGHVKIGSRVQVAAQSAVMKDFNGPLKLMGSPARPMQDQLRLQALIRRLPEILERLAELESHTLAGSGQPQDRDTDRGTSGSTGRR